MAATATIRAQARKYDWFIEDLEQVVAAAPGERLGANAHAVSPFRPAAPARPECVHSTTFRWRPPSRSRLQARLRRHGRVRRSDRTDVAGVDRLVAPGALGAPGRAQCAGRGAR